MGVVWELQCPAVRGACFFVTSIPALLGVDRWVWGLGTGVSWPSLRWEAAGICTRGVLLWAILQPPQAP